VRSISKTHRTYTDVERVIVDHIDNIILWHRLVRCIYSIIARWLYIAAARHVVPTT